MHNAKFTDCFVIFLEIRFEAQVKEIQAGIREPLTSQHNLDIVRDVCKRS